MGKKGEKFFVSLTNARVLVGLAKENTSRCPVKVVTTCRRKREYAFYWSFTEVQTGLCRRLLKGTLRVFIILFYDLYINSLYYMATIVRAL